MIGELEAAKIWDKPIVTEVTQFRAFYPAEEDHREYFRRNPDQPYCRIVIEPKELSFAGNSLQSSRNDDVFAY